MTSAMHHRKVSGSTSEPQVFFDLPARDFGIMPKNGTTVKVVRPSSIFHKREFYDSKGKKLKEPQDYFTVKKSRGNILAFASLGDAIKHSGVKMVPCPAGTEVLVPEGDVRHLNKHLETNLRSRFEEMKKEAGFSKFLPYIYVYPDGYFIRPRKISPHCPSKSFSSKAELDRELKRVNPSSPTEFHMEEMCQHGSSCRGKDGSCPLNHPGVPICRYEKDHTHRCKGHSCRYNHWKGRVPFVLNKRIAFQEKKIAAEESSKKSDDSSVDNIYDAFMDDSDDEDSAKSIAVSIAEDAISEVNDEETVSTEDSGAGFQKISSKKARKLTSKEYLEKLKTQKKVYQDSKKAFKKKSKRSTAAAPSKGKKDFPEFAKMGASKDKSWSEKIAETNAKKEAALAAVRLKAVKVLQNFYLIIQAKDYVAKKKALLAKQREIKEARIQKKLEQARKQAAEQLEKEVLSEMFAEMAVVNTSDTDESDVQLSKKEKKRLRKEKKIAEKSKSRVDPSLLGFTTD